MSEIKKFEFEGNKITFLTGENIMVNATEMAKPFDIKPHFWLKNDSTQRLISDYCEFNKVNSSDLVRVKYGDDGGTWIHVDIALLFAQWLQPKFYFWCNDRIKELFKYGITALNEEVREKVFKLSELAHMAKEKRPDKIGRSKFYEELRQRGLLNAHNKPYPKWVEKGFFKYELYHDDEYIKYPVVTEAGMKWLTEFLFPNSADNSALLHKLDQLLISNELILRAQEAQMNTAVVAKISSITTRDEQLRIAAEKTRDVCSEIKRFLNKDTDLPIPLELTTHKLDIY